jgi:predicted ArsR family transcriptional regulator
VTREEAADAAAISRTLTAFHLDKLVDAGLLRARYEAPSDRQRGRGRTPKVYEVTAGGLSLTVPPRQYELVGEILADAVATRPGDAVTASQSYAFERGRALGEACLPVGDDELTTAYAVLADLGFEPRAGEALTLGNCPFHALAQRRPELICAINEAFVRGLLSGLGSTLDAQLAPLPGACCVRITAAGACRTEAADPR